MFSTTNWFEGGWHYHSSSVEDREVSLPHYADYGDTAVTYTKVFTCSVDADKRYLFCCEGNLLDITVEMNGVVLVAEKDTDSGCICWDATASVAENNTLTLKIADAPAGARSGVFHNVWWREVSAVSVVNLPSVTTYFTDKGIACLRSEVRLLNVLDTPRAVTVAYRLVSPAGETVHAFEKKTILCPQVEGFVPIAIDTLRVDAWTPEKPTVYRLQVEVADGETVVEKFTKSVAFRTVSFENDFCFLNGDLLFLKGLYYAEQDLLAPADNIWYRLCKHAKVMGCNALAVANPPAFAADTAMQMGLLLLDANTLPQEVQIYTPFAFVDGGDTAAKQRETALAALAAFGRAEKDSRSPGFLLDHRMAVDSFGLRTMAVPLFAAAFGKTPVFEMEYTEQTVGLYSNAVSYTVYINDHPMQELPSAGALTLFSLDTPFAELKVAAHFADGKDLVRRLRPTGRAVALRVTAHTYDRNLGNNRVDYIAVTAEAVDAHGNRVTDFTDTVEFIPYTSGVLRAEEDFTADTGISSDKFGNVVGGKKTAERTDGYRVPMKGGVAVVRLSAKNNSRFTAISGECSLGKDTAFVNY